MWFLLILWEFIKLFWKSKFFFLGGILFLVFKNCDLIINKCNFDIVNVWVEKKNNKNVWKGIF